MRIQSELCHISDNKAVVKVLAWEKDLFLGSSLGEGGNAEEAEERAIKRLNSRLGLMMENKPENKSLELKKDKSNKGKDNFSTNHEFLSSQNQEKDKENESIDWSEELIELDLEIKRLGWGKEEERNYIMKTLGYKSRNRITALKDLKFLIDNLKNINNNFKRIDESEDNQFKSLLKENNLILDKLGWENQKAREFLKSLLGANSRKELTSNELEIFNKELEKELK